MKKIKIIARQQIISTATGKLHDDIGLKALNGYREYYAEVEDTHDTDAVIDKFIADNPEYRSADFEINDISRGIIYQM